MISLLIFVLAFGIGYEIFVYFNDPIKQPRREKKRLPKIRYKNLEILPYVRIHYRQKTFHIHHWLTLSIITVLSITIYSGWTHAELLRGVAVGGIIQGLRYPDRFKFTMPRIG